MKSWNEIRRGASAFAKRWKNAYDEKSLTQSFLKEFFEVFGAMDYVRVLVNAEPSVGFALREDRSGRGAPALPQAIIGFHLANSHAESAENAEKGASLRSLRTPREKIIYDHLSCFV